MSTNLMFSFCEETVVDSGTFVRDIVMARDCSVLSRFLNRLSGSSGFQDIRGKKTQLFCDGSLAMCRYSSDDCIHSECILG